MSNQLADLQTVSDKQELVHIPDSQGLDPSPSIQTMATAVQSRTDISCCPPGHRQLHHECDAAHSNLTEVAVCVAMVGTRHTVEDWHFLLVSAQ
jgi:hypothetical protein